MNIPNIIAQVSAERSVTLFKTERVNLLLNIASIIDPNAPTPAASVGVATPANIDPNTKKIRKIGGINDLKIIFQRSIFVLGPISSGSGGANCGLNLVLKYIYIR